MSKWRLTEDQPGIPPIKPEPNMELDIVTLSVLRLLSSPGRPIWEANTEHAVQSLTSGRLTKPPTSSLGIPVPLPDTTGAQGLNVETEGIGTTVFVIRMAVGSIPSEMETKISMVLALVSRWTQVSLSRWSLNSSLLMELTVERSMISGGFMSKTGRNLTFPGPISQA